MRKRERFQHLRFKTSHSSVIRVDVSVEDVIYRSSAECILKSGVQRHARVWWIIEKIKERGAMRAWRNRGRERRKGC